MHLEENAAFGCVDFSIALAFHYVLKVELRKA